MVIGCGNFGAPPQPPFVASKLRWMSSTAVSRIAGVGVAPDAALRACPESCPTSEAADCSMSARCSRHARSMPSSTWRKLGMPWRGVSGKYVPP
jgi:hypothetical protein